MKKRRYKQTIAKLNVIQLRRVPEVDFFLSTIKREKLTVKAQLLLMEYFFLKDGKHHSYMTNGINLTPRSLQYLIGYSRLKYYSLRKQAIEEIETPDSDLPDSLKSKRQVEMFSEYFKTQLEKGLSRIETPVRPEYVVILVKIDRYGKHRFMDLWKSNLGKVKLFNSEDAARKAFKNNVKVDYFQAFVVDVTAVKLDLIIQ